MFRGRVDQRVYCDIRCNGVRCAEIYTDTYNGARLYSSEVYTMITLSMPSMLFTTNMARDAILHPPRLLNYRLPPLIS